MGESDSAASTKHTTPNAAWVTKKSGVCAERAFDKRGVQLCCLPSPPPPPRLESQRYHCHLLFPSNNERLLFPVGNGSTAEPTSQISTIQQQIQRQNFRIFISSKAAFAASHKTKGELKQPRARERWGGKKKEKKKISPLRRI